MPDVPKLPSAIAQSPANAAVPAARATETMRLPATTGESGAKPTAPESGPKRAATAGASDPRAANHHQATVPRKRRIPGAYAPFAVRDTPKMANAESAPTWGFIAASTHTTASRPQNTGFENTPGPKAGKFTSATAPTKAAAATDTARATTAITRGVKRSAKGTRGAAGTGSPSPFSSSPFPSTPLTRRDSSALPAFTSPK